MKRYIYSLMVLLCSITAPVLAQGIQFSEGSWAEIKAMAKAQNKHVFIDFYTDWCAPCKYMSKNIFPQKEAGDFYNANFISYKVNAEKGEGPALARQYGVGGYPTLAYLDYNGEVIHRLTSSIDVEGLISHGKMALVPQDDYAKLKAAFDKNELGTAELYRYFIMVKTKGMPKETDLVFDRYFDAVAKVDAETFKLISDNVSSTASKPFKYLEAHAGGFAGVIGKEKLNAYLKNMYLEDFKYQIWYKSYPDEQAYMAAKAILKSKVSLSEKEELGFDTDFYLRTENEDKYIVSADKLIKKYYYNDYFEISNLLGGSSRMIKTKKNLLITKKWAMYALSLKDNSLNNATLALVYKNLNDKVMALKYINLSIDASIRDKDGYEERIGSFKQDILAMP